MEGIWEAPKWCILPGFPGGKSYCWWFARKPVLRERYFIPLCIQGFEIPRWCFFQKKRTIQALKVEVKFLDLWFRPWCKFPKIWTPEWWWQLTPPSKRLNTIFIRGASVKFGSNNSPEMGQKYKNIYWLVVSTHLKNISQNGSFPQIGMNIKNHWNHHLDIPFKYWLALGGSRLSLVLVFCPKNPS